MMPKSSEIEGLLSRLEAATGPDRELDHRLQGILVNDGNFGHYAGLEEWVTAGMEFGWNTPAYTASIDAALALVERLLPGWRRRLEEPHGDGGWRASLIWPDQEDVVRAKVAEAPTAPLAILLALFRALSARPRP
jgi:hypothetical protein